MSKTWPPGPVDLVTAYRERCADRIAVADTGLARVALVDPKLNCFMTMYPAVRPDAADCTAELRAGAPLLAFEGVPVALKDILVSQGMPASRYSAIFADRGVCKAPAGDRVWPE